MVRAKAANTVIMHLTPAYDMEDASYVFYSRLEAEKYKRNFLAALYCMSGNFVRPDTRPRFLKKRNLRRNYNMQEHAILRGLASIQYYPRITDSDTGQMKVSSANEFIVVKL